MSDPQVHPQSQDNPQDPLLQHPPQPLDAAAADPNLEDEFQQLSSGPNSPTAPSKACAKDWDYALLKECSAKRLTSIAKEHYPGCDPKANKPEKFQHIHDSMLDEQDCEICNGNCNPATHYFPPSAPPPQGWKRGPDGLFAPPSTPSTHTPVSSSPAPGLQAIRPASTPGTSTSSGYTPPVGPPRATSPGHALLRPSLSHDLPVGNGPNPYVPGIHQQPPAPRNAAQVVMQGAANMVHNGITSLSAPIFPTVSHQVPGTVTAPTSSVASGPPVVTPQTLSNTQRDQELARVRRQKEFEDLQRQIELQRQQQAHSSLLAQQHQQLLEAEQAEERAHQERLQQLRASLAPPPVPLPPAAPAPSSLFSPLASHSPASSFIPIPTHSHLGAAPSIAHSSHSPIYGGSPLAPIPAAGASSPLPMSALQIQAMIDQRVQALTNPTGPSASHCHSHGTSSVCADHGTNKLKTNKVVNNDMAARFGVFAQPLFEVDGDIESGDISKMRKVLKPGRDDVGSGMVLRQTAWPHKMLQRTVPGFDEVSHKDLTFH